jgi:hypothetical protein
LGFPNHFNVSIFASFSLKITQGPVLFYLVCCGVFIFLWSLTTRLTG